MPSTAIKILEENDSYQLSGAQLASLRLATINRLQQLLFWREPHLKQAERN